MVYAEISSAPDPVFDDLDDPALSIIIPVHGQWRHLRECLVSIKLFTTGRYEVIVVDDGSPDETPRMLLGVRGLRIITHGSAQGFVASCNAGAAISRAPTLCLLNSDTVVLEGWSDALLRTLERTPKAGLVGARLVYPNGQLQESGCVVWRDGSARNLGMGLDADDPGHDWLRDVDYVSAACCVLRRSVFEAVGGFDHRYSPAFYEDVDLAFKIRETGLRVLCQPQAMIVHVGGATCGTDDAVGIKRNQPIHREVFVERWRHVLAGHHAPAAIQGWSGRMRPSCGVLIIDEQGLVEERDAGCVVLEQLILSLSRLGLHVAFAALIEPAAAPGWRQRLAGMGVRVVRGVGRAAIARHLDEQGSGYDMTIAVRHHVFAEVRDVLAINAPGARRVLLVADLHHLRLRRRQDIHPMPDGERQAEAEARAEWAAISAADAVITHSDVEARMIRARVSGARISTIPWIVQGAVGRTSRLGRTGVLFIGSFAHAPNADALRVFLTRVWRDVAHRVPEAVFHVVGADPPVDLSEVALPGVVFHGRVADLAPILELSAVAIAPIEWGAGFKGKVATYAAAGIPMVVTPIAVEGTGLTDGAECLIAGLEEFAERIVGLFRNDSVYALLSQAAATHARNAWSAEMADRRLVSLRSELGLPSTDAIDAVVVQAEARNTAKRNVSGRCIIRLGVIDWHYRIQRPQQIALGLVDLGWQVVYMNATMCPAPIGTGVRFMEQIRDGLTVANLECPGTPPVIYRDEPEDRCVASLAGAVRGMTERLGITQPIVVVDHPFWWPVAQAVRAATAGRVVYDCMDMHTAFPDSGPWLQRLERSLVDGADAVICSSAGLCRTWASRVGIELIRNGCDHAVLSRGAAPRPGAGQPVIGYVGAIEDWFDVELVIATATRRPELRLVLAGRCKANIRVRLSACRNIHLLGEVPYDAVPGLMSGFDVGIIPFRVNDLTRVTDPVKAYEYLASGLPVVATPMPELQDALAGQVHIGHGLEGWLHALDQALSTAKDADLVSSRMSTARQHDWSCRAASMARVLERLRDRAGAG